ncbi:peptidase M24, structural domain-containing protein [Lipomyces kononenkoae]|uniref:Peptidase M24, structural domain-containing protein n=1 Tax=Lipomyces kononenkoae TaxID=34357 RepID=A0ACC3TAM7_LIPKO
MFVLIRRANQCRDKNITMRQYMRTCPSRHFVSMNALDPATTTTTIKIQSGILSLRGTRCVIPMTYGRRCQAIRGQRGYAVQAGFGQPTFETRPHMLKEGELTPGISALEYHFRRHKLIEQLPVGAAAVLVGNELKYRSGAVFYEFHQNPNFFYLSGFNEPRAVMVIEKLVENDYRFHLYVQPKDERKELWEGPRTGVDGALEVFNADEAGDIKFIRKYLDDIIGRAKSIYMDIPPGNSEIASLFHPHVRRATMEYNILELIKHHKKETALRPLTRIVQSLRAVKSDAELKVMQMAGKISGQSITRAYGRRFSKEADLNAYLDYAFRIGGCEKSAYVPVVAGGKNALGIHYTRNDDILNDGEMVLIDAGGQYGGYCADISRAWPVNGKFTEPQKDLYQAVLNVQKECIKLATTSNALESIHRSSVDLFAIELRNIGFNASLSDINATLYPHYVGHHLGLDVHDCPDEPRRQNLKTGNVITIEPGIYVPADDQKFPKHFRGIGIRIEDNVYIEDDSPIVTSAAAVKEIKDIEQACDSAWNDMR